MLRWLRHAWINAIALRHNRVYIVPKKIRHGYHLAQGFLNFLSRVPLDTNPRNSRLT